MDLPAIATRIGAIQNTNIIAESDTVRHGVGVWGLQSVFVGASYRYTSLLEGREGGGHPGFAGGDQEGDRGEPDQQALGQRGQGVGDGQGQDTGSCGGEGGRTCQG